MPCRRLLMFRRIVVCLLLVSSPALAWQSLSFSLAGEHQDFAYGGRYVESRGIGGGLEMMRVEGLLQWSVALVVVSGEDYFYDGSIIGVLDVGPSLSMHSVAGLFGIYNLTVPEELDFGLIPSIGVQMGGLMGGYYDEWDVYDEDFFGMTLRLKLFVRAWRFLFTAGVGKDYRPAHQAILEEAGNREVPWPFVWNLSVGWVF